MMVAEKKLRINMQMAPSLLKELDAYSKKKGLSRSSAISTCISTVLQQEKSMELMPDLLKAYEKIKSNH